MEDIRNGQEHSSKAAERGEPSYVWRAGQIRRMELIKKYAGERINGCVLEDGCGVGSYLSRFMLTAGHAVGIEIEYERAHAARQLCTGANADVVTSCGEYLPFRDEYFDLILSHEVIEHVNDDLLCVREMVRVLKPGGRIVLFCPNRGYPFETHGIYWKGEYHFGNKLFVNYLPRSLRDKLAPHVNIYTAGDLEKLFAALPVKFVERTVIFGAYDNLIRRFGILGKGLRAVLQGLEKTPLRVLGLSHLWVIEKTA